MIKTQRFKASNILNFSIGKQFTINIWVLVILFFSIANGYANIYLIAFSTSLLHEFAHVFCAKALKIPISKIIIYPFGVCAKLSDIYIKNSEKEFAVAFSGPFLNLVLFWLCIFISNTHPEPLITYCADINLAMCILNLIPALPLDGGRMLKSILTLKYGIIRAYNFMLKLSRVLMLLVFVVALIFFFVFRSNFSLILISAFLLQNMCSEQKTITLITLKEILNSKDKLSVSSETRTKTLCVSELTPARTLLNQLSYDYFYIINVMNASGEIVKTLTEIQVLTSLTEKGIRIKYSEI